MIELIDSVERISPRVPERQRRRREERPFPAIPVDDDEDAADPETDASDEPETPSTRTRVGDDDEHRIDVTVAGRFLPGRQFLPGMRRGVTLH